MKRHLRIYAILIAGVMMTSCEKMFMDTNPNDFSKVDVFESMWKTVDEKYSYLEYKDIDWDSIYRAHRPRITEKMTALELYTELYDMLYDLRDGHVNLYAGFDYARNWEWYLDAPQNFSYAVVERNYLGKNHWASGGLKNTLLDDGKYGYIYYSSFSSSVDYMPVILSRFEDAKGIILDLRDNGGGMLDNAERLANYLADQRRLTYKLYYKKGTSHDDFSAPYEHYSGPVGKAYTRPVVILTNRSCYSATSYFVTMAKEFPNVTVLGDTTGGGAGLPMDYILPGGWQLRISSTRGTDARGKDFELGVEPDVRHDVDIARLMIGEDSMIEYAKTLIDATGK